MCSIFRLEIGLFRTPLPHAGNVTCAGAADYIVVKADAVHRIPDNVDLVLAAADPVANALHAVRQSGLQVTDRVLVLGAGPIGA